MPSRLPFLSRILQNMSQHTMLQHTNICMVAPSYRGFAIILYLSDLREVTGRQPDDHHKQGWNKMHLPSLNGFEAALPIET